MLQYLTLDEKDHAFPYRIEIFVRERKAIHYSDIGLNLTKAQTHNVNFEGGSDRQDVTCTIKKMKKKIRRGMRKRMTNL